MITLLPPKMPIDFQDFEEISINEMIRLKRIIFY